MMILVAGDLVPTEINIELFNEADTQSLLGEGLNKLWNSSSFRICNLEVPLYDKNNPIFKSGPNLKAPKSTIKGIKALNPTLLSLANNHIMDHGVEGLSSTLQLLEENNIPYVGIGNSLNSMTNYYFLSQGEKEIGVYACAQNEYSIATDSKPGANPFDPLESLDHIKELKSKCDYVIVLYHGGIEHYRYPSPYDQKISKKMIDYGADLIVFQHSHCVGCFEEYKGSTIVYGQGNFLFNKYDNEYWNSGLLIKLEIDKEIKVDYIPIIRNEKGIQLAQGNESAEILQGFYLRSKEILDKHVLQKKYNDFANSKINNYLCNLSGLNKWIYRIDKYLFRGKILEFKYPRERVLRVQNYFSCESHRELIVKGLMNKISDE